MDGYGKRVLIAEDEESVRHRLAVVLEEAGYTVQVVEEGMEALAEMKKRRFDAVVAVFRMRRLDGEQFLLLSSLMWPPTPALFLSSEHTDVPEVLSIHGACALVPKPFDPQGLLQAMQSALETDCACSGPQAVVGKGE